MVDLSASSPPDTFRLFFWLGSPQIAGTVWEKYDKELGGTEMKPGDDQSLLDVNYVTQLLSSVSPPSLSLSPLPLSLHACSK